MNNLVINVSIVAIGLNINIVEFSISPPYFDFSEINWTEAGEIDTNTIEYDVKRAISSLIL